MARLRHDALSRVPSPERDGFISVAWDGNRHVVEGLTSGFVSTGKGSADQDLFCSWNWDGNVLTVNNDRYGFLPLFYRVTANTITISPSLMTLLEKGAYAGIDHTALYLFLHLGYYVSDQTAFAEIKVVPPAVRFLWSRGALTIGGGYHWGKRQCLRRREAIDAMRCLFTQAISRRRPNSDRYAVPLSGGRDSRHILLELADQGFRNPICVTARIYGRIIDEDVVAAAQLTAALGLGHAIVDPPMPIIAAEAKKNAQTHYCADEHRWYLSVAEYLGNRADVVYDGIAGDVLTDTLGSGQCTVAMSQQFDSARFSAIAQQILGNVDSTIRSLVPAHAYEQMDRAVALDVLRAELAKHAEAPNPVASFFFWNRTRREVSLIPYGLLRGMPTVHSPFLDHDLYDLMTSLPWTCVADNQWHTQTILESYPKYAHIPFALQSEDESRSAPAMRRHELRYARELAALASQPTNSSVPLVKRLPVIGMLSASSLSSRVARRYGWMFDRLTYLLQLEGLVARFHR
jgi:asparagine synthase (glutamine-hydrolysing)